MSWKLFTSQGHALVKCTMATCKKKTWVPSLKRWCNKICYLCFFIIIPTSSINYPWKPFSNTGHLTTDENRVLLEELTPFPSADLLLRRRPAVYKFVIQDSIAYSLFQMDKNVSQRYRKQQRHLLHKAIQVLPSYATCQWDLDNLPQRVTFLNA